MMELSALNWATPPGALLLLAPLLLAALAWRRRQKLAAWADPQLQPWAVASRGESGGNWRRIVEVFAWLLLALAAAGPRLPLDDGGGADTPGNVRHVMSVMVALDVSASMAATDVAPNRLQRARLELADLSRRLKGERVGLALYAGRSGVLLPPTDDAPLFARALDLADTDLFEDAGSNVGAALDVAGAALAKEKTRSRAVLLVTDAEADSLVGPAREAAHAAAMRLKAAGIPLYVLGVGSTPGAPIPVADGSGGWVERDGVQVISRTDGAAYAELAQLTGGRYVAAGDGDSDWESLYDQGIARLPAESVAPDQVRAWQPLFTWPLACALVLFGLARLPRLSRRNALPAAAVLLALGATAAHEARADEAQAWQAYRAERWGEAARLYGEIGGYAGQMGAGAAAWKLKDYGGAARHYGAALLLARNDQQRYDALYNLGNANYGLTHWQTAAEAYRAVLRARPKDEYAAGNLVRAENQLRKRRNLPPLKTDLRLHAGIAAEGGEINTDWDREGPIQEFAPTPGGLQGDRAAAAGATLNAEQAAAQRAELDARRLQSGLAKLERLEERPRALIKGLLKQDTPPDAGALELMPW